MFHDFPKFMFFHFLLFLLETPSYKMTEPLFAFEPLKTKSCYAEDMLKMSSRRVQGQQMFGGFAPANFLQADSVTVNQPHVKDPFKLLTWSVRTKFCLKCFYFHKTNLPYTFLWLPNTPPTSFFQEFS